MKTPLFLFNNTLSVPCRRKPLIMKKFGLILFTLLASFAITSCQYDSMPEWVDGAWMSKVETTTFFLDINLDENTYTFIGEEVTEDGTRVDVVQNGKIQFDSHAQEVLFFPEAYSMDMGSYSIGTIYKDIYKYIYVDGDFSFRDTMEANDSDEKGDKFHFSVKRKSRLGADFKPIGRAQLPDIDY